jgi:hypothetical protein
VRKSECGWLISESWFHVLSLGSPAMNIKKAGWRMLLFLFVLLEGISVPATTFTYTAGDVLICFRKTGGGTLDLEVDAGPISTFTNLAIGQKITIANYTGAQLARVGTNSISWSAFTYLDASTTGTPTNVLYMSNPRYDLNTQTDPYGRYNNSSQGLTVSQIKSIISGMTNYVNYTNASSSTASLVPESASTPPYISYIVGLGPNLNFNNTFQTDPEQSTSGSFTTSGQPMRADLYRLYPSAGGALHPDGEYLGYFELSTNGVMTYTAGPSATVLVAASITSVARSGTTNTVTFTTGSGGTYFLCGTNNLMAPMTNWPSFNSVAGDGSSHSLTHVTTASSMYYIIKAQ